MKRLAFLELLACSSAYAQTTLGGNGVRIIPRSAAPAPLTAGGCTGAGAGHCIGWWAPNSGGSAYKPLWSNGDGTNFTPIDSTGTSTNFSGSLTGDVTGTQGATSVIKLQGRSVSSNAPTNNQVLTWVALNSDWEPMSPAATGVTSVGLALPGIFTVSGSPVTNSGTLTGTLNTQNANLVWAGPSTGAAATPTFRSLVTADLPTTAVSAGSYGSASAVGTFTVDATGRLTAAASSSIAIGDAAITYASRAANLIWAGPSSGAAAAPTFRSLVTADLPTTAVSAGSYGSASSVGTFTVDGTGRLTAASNTSIAISDSAITYGSESANLFLASPNGSSGAPSYRAIANADLPAAGTAGSYSYVTTNSKGLVTAGSLITLTATAPITGGGDLSTNRSFGLDQTFAYSWTGVHTFTKTSVGTAQTVEATITNTTAAANNAQQFSPVAELVGQGWGTTGSASQTVKFGLQTHPVQSTTATGQLDILSSLNGGAYSVVHSVDSTGNLLLPNTSGIKIIRQTNNGAVVFGDSGPYLTPDNGGNYFQITTSQAQSTVRIVPVTDNSVSSGASASRWNAVWAFQHAGVAQTVANSASPTLAPASGELILCNLGATSETLGGAAGQPAQRIVVEVRQDGTGGRSFAFGGGTNGFRLAGGAYTPSSGANAKDVLIFVWNSTDSKWDEMSRALNIQ